jgi:hypothetical protein
VERAAQDVLTDGRAKLVVTTERAFWNLPACESEGERMLALLPSAERTAAVGLLRGEVTDQPDGWHLFVGLGPHFGSPPPDRSMVRADGL